MNQTISKVHLPSLEEALLHRQKKKMSKILKTAWDFDEAMHPFQICNDVEIVFSAGSSPPYDLQNFILFLANDRYEVGRKGWEKFALDLGSLYLRFISKSKLKHLASKHLDQVCKLLEQVDTNLAPIARNMTPSEYAAYFMATDSDSSGFDSDDDLPICSLRSSSSSMNTTRSIDSDSDDELPIISLRTSFSSTNSTARSIDFDSDVDGSNFGFSKKQKSKTKGKKVPRKKKVEKKRKAKSLNSKKSRKRKSRK